MSNILKAIIRANIVKTAATIEGTEEDERAAYQHEGREMARMDLERDEERAKEDARLAANPDLRRCYECNGEIFHKDRMHYPGNDPEIGPAHTPVSKEEWDAELADSVDNDPMQWDDEPMCQACGMSMDAEGRCNGCHSPEEVCDCNLPAMVVNQSMSSRLVKAANRAEQALSKLAKKDKGHTGFVFPKTHPKVTDNKDHFPISDERHGRSALQEMAKYKKVPSWYSGSLEGLRSAISRAVHSKHPGIKQEKDK
jgi:hypothetical protein